MAAALVVGPLLGALTGAGGGIIRDVIRADAHNPGLEGAFLLRGGDYLEIDFKPYTSPAIQQITSC